MKEKINRRTTILVALFLITTVFIAASLYAVSNRPAENANRISACDDPTPDSLHADSVFEQDYTRLPVDEETEIDILLPAGYRGSQASDFDHMYSESWYDFYEDGAGYFDLKKADLEIGNSYDDCIGDSVAYVGSARDGLLLIKGIKPAASGVETMKAEQDNVPAILNVWFGGSEAAYAIGDVLFGRVNPSGKLTMSFPQNVGQIPLYYAHKNTGRPLHDGKWFEKFRSNYLDVTNEPLYPFGFGLSYTTFAYSDISLSQSSMDMQGMITASVDVSNTGLLPGGEVVQLYIRDLVGSTTRPVKELKGFERIYLQPGQTRTVTFKIAPEMLKFYDYDLQYVIEPGDFQVMIGSNSRDVKTAAFTVTSK